MKYQVGDKILVLHSNEEGEIIDIINDKMVLIDVRGVKFPAYMDQIDFPYFKRFSEKKLFPQKKEKKYIDDLKKDNGAKGSKIAPGVWITFLPVMETDEFGDDVVKELKIHLLNGTDKEYNFIYKLIFFGDIDFELKNTLHTGEDFYLHDIAFEHLNDSPSFDFEFTLGQRDKWKADFFEYSLKLKPKQLFNRIEELKKKNEATFSYSLFEEYPDKVDDMADTGKPANGQYKIYDAKHARQHLEAARSVVDLHIEKITNDWKHLSNFEIVTLQLKTFEKFYDLALIHHLRSIIIIHGIGEGKLRDEIHDILRLKKDVKSFVNQYHPAYGYGAT
ncbi:MAG: hypothetical protein JWM28_713, partial [Chitinophagaceae bacterium]|nr:hypothetical protein [Chitinophagaceae bacterium]